MCCTWDNRAVSIVSADVRSGPGINKIRRLTNPGWYHIAFDHLHDLVFLELSSCVSQWNICYSLGDLDRWTVRRSLLICLYGCMFFFFSLLTPERPVNADQQERTLLKGVFSVRKGKSQLHKWAERQVILCGTCLIVASVKDSLTGKMHILPLVGGKVRVQFSWWTCYPLIVPIIVPAYTSALMHWNKLDWTVE